LSKAFLSVYIVSYGQFHGADKIEYTQRTGNGKPEITKIETGTTLFMGINNFREEANKVAQIDPFIHFSFYSTIPHSYRGWLENR